MKKVLAVLAIAGTLVACNNEGSNDANADTATIVQPDTMQVITDTTINRDTIGRGINENPTTGDTSTRR